MDIIQFNFYCMISDKWVRNWTIKWWRGDVNTATYEYLQYVTRSFLNPLKKLKDLNFSSSAEFDSAVSVTPWRFCLRVNICAKSKPYYNTFSTGIRRRDGLDSLKTNVKSRDTVPLRESTAQHGFVISASIELREMKTVFYSKQNFWDPQSKQYFG